MATCQVLNCRLTDDSGGELYNVAIKDGVIAAIELASAGGGASPSDTYDAKGHYLAPSMRDNHVHFGWWSRLVSRADLHGAESASEAATAIIDYKLKRPPENKDPLVGWGLMVGKWPDIDVMTREYLDDKVANDIPVVLFLSDGHSCWVNTAALDFFGIAPDSAAYSGVLREKDCFEASKKLDESDETNFESFIDKAMDEAAAKGVTEIVELEMAHNIEKWSARIARGADKLRVDLGMYEDHIDDAISRGWKTGHVVPDSKGLLKVGPFKIITDGSLGTRTACCYRPYPPPAGREDCGEMSYTDQELYDMFMRGTENGLRLAVHAIGDKANATVLDILSTLPKRPLPDSTIEHAQLLRWSDVPRFNELGLAASVQPQHLCDDRELTERFWPHDAERTYVFRSLDEAKCELRLGSDAPIAPLDPWLAMAAAVTRSRAGEIKHGYPGWHPEQRISMRKAYAASTSGKRVKVSVGDVADVCIIDRDPLALQGHDQDDVRYTQVYLTLLEGRATHNTL